jgi:hypothetical protein
MQLTRQARAPLRNERSSQLAATGERAEPLVPNQSEPPSHLPFVAVRCRPNQRTSMAGMRPENRFLSAGVFTAPHPLRRSTTIASA